MIRKNAGRRHFLKRSATVALSAAAYPLVSSGTLRDVSDRGWQQSTTAASAQSALIKLDFDRQLGTIDRNIYGNFIEHLGRCIYGGIYDEGSPLSDSDGFRKDVLEAVRNLRISVLRWPGGNFSSGYNWKDGIGPKDLRPRRWDTAWQAEESNRFGTDEFIAYCRKVGAEPYICVNMGTGTMQEAADWVEYCNGTMNTDWANLRRKNGHPEPYSVKLWGLGNEIYGSWQAGHKDATQYAQLAAEFAKMMRWIDPDIKLVACGGNNADWDRQVLEGVGQFADYISMHHYGGSLDTAKEIDDAHRLEQQVRVLEGVLVSTPIHGEKKSR